MPILLTMDHALWGIILLVFLDQYVIFIYKIF